MSALTGKVDARDPSVDPSEFRNRWEHLWKGGVVPGAHWDAADASPALLDLLGSGKLGSLSGKRVFIPGCGRGYDLMAFHKAGAARAVGLELAESAVQEAGAYLTSSLGEGSQDKAQVYHGNFFTWDDPQGPFDVGFDYTFGCAMHPADRGLWAAGWSRALKPGATLVSLIFPVDPNADPNIGPPFPINRELYEGLLGDTFKLESCEPVPEHLSHPSRRGKEQLALWTRK